VLAARFPDSVNLTRAYITLRQVKSAEELDWLRVGAHFPTAAWQRCAMHCARGQRARARRGDRARLRGAGRHNVIHYIGTTSMAAPDLAVPRQFLTPRRLQAGGRRGGEISAAFWDSSRAGAAQLRAGEPTKLYRDLHAAADAAFDGRRRGAQAGPRAQVIEASGVIEAGRLQHHRRPAARLRRRLSAADPRQQEPAIRPAAAGAFPRGPSWSSSSPTW